MFPMLQQFEDLDEAKQVYAAIVAAGDRDVGKILSVLDELSLSENTIVIFSSDNGPESQRPLKNMTICQRDQAWVVSIRSERRQD